jgi:hypothetical protein
VPGGLFSDLMIAAGHAKIYKAPIMQVFTPGYRDAYPQPGDDPYGFLYRPGQGGPGLDVEPRRAVDDSTIETDSITDEP